MSRKFLRQKQKKEKKMPDHPAFVAGVRAHQQGDLQGAEKCYRQVLQQLPEHTDSIFNLGVIFQNTNRINDAMGAYQRVIKLKDDYDNAYINLGLILERRGRFSDALQVYHRATQVKPTYIAYYNLAGPLYQLKKYKDAEVALRESIKLNPNYALSRMNLGTILKETKRYDEAQSQYEESLRLEPNLPDVHFNIGKIYDSKNQFSDAIISYKKALEIDSEHEKAQAALFYRYQRACMWAAMEQLEPQLDKITNKLVAAGKCPGITNFSQIARCDDLEQNLKIAEAWSESIVRKVAPEQPEFSFAERATKKDKLVIGYLSADFREHAFGQITQYFYGAHDKEKFEIRGYAIAPDDGGQCRKVIENGCDYFTDLSHASDIAAAQKIYDDGVDILVELTGYTAGARMEISAMRPAPIQVNYDGFVGTAGADFLDYIIVDEIVVPKEQQSYYTEKLAIIPHTLQVNHRNEKIAQEGFSRKDFGLPEEGVVFCSFNQPYKVDPVMFGVWMELLQEVPDSILWLRTGEEAAQENILLETEKHGIDKSRVIFADKLMNRSEYYRRIQFADLALDTRIYNGGSTTMDALWAGVPVVTLLGKHYASRMSAGLINGANMPELITHSMEEYKELALSLATNPKKLNDLKDKLWQQREVCPLFDTAQITRNIEKAYAKMWARYVAGNPPEIIEITE